jgi:hypothetical protein
MLLAPGLLLLAGACTLVPAAEPVDPPPDTGLERVISDYTGLYKRDTLDEWRKLFLPGFVAGSLRPDGSVLQRNLDEFYGAQKRYLDSGRAIRETLEDVETRSFGTVASVTAAFVLEDEGERSRGRLILTLLGGEGAFRIQSLVFAYDAKPSAP